MNQKLPLTQHYFFAVTLIFTGGFLNGYSFILHGGVLAAAQTSNFLQLAYYLSEQKWKRAFSHFVPIVCFCIAIFFTKYAFDTWCKKKNRIWKLWILCVQIGIFFLIGFLHKYLSNIIVNSLIAFCTAMQYCGFRTFGTNSPYATIFCTGNMRSLMDNVYDAIIKKDKKSRENVKGYLLILGGFFLGVICCNYLSKIVGGYAIWLVCVVLGIDCLRMGFFYFK